MQAEWVVSIVWMTSNPLAPATLRADSAAVFSST
jgi:hypothetical protein